MIRNLKNLILSLSLAVAALACVTLAGQNVGVPVAKQEKEKSFTAALRESVPPVDIYAEHIVFNRIVRIEAVESLKADGRPSRAPAVLQAIGSGLVIDAVGRASRIDVDDLLVVGDLIIGGVGQNAGDHPVRIRFDSGHEMTLQPSEVFYVGTYERLLRPDQIPGAQGAVAGNPVEVIGGPGSHCWVCQCTCGSTTVGSCDITVDANSGTDCSSWNGVECDCPDPAAVNTTSNCKKRLIPCTA